MPRVRVLIQNTFGQSRQTIELLAHIRDASSQPDLRLCRNRDHTISPATKARRPESAVGPSTNIRRPSDNVISTHWAETDASNSRTSSTTGTVTEPSSPHQESRHGCPVHRSRVPAQISGPSTTCGSDWHSSNTVAQPAPPTHPTLSSAHKSTASRHPTRTTLLPRHKAPQDVHYQTRSITIRAGLPRKPL